MNRIIIGLVLVLPLLLQAVSFSVEEPVVVAGEFSNQLPCLLNPGDPAVAYQPVRLLVAMGERVTAVEVVFDGEQHKRQIGFLDYARQQYPVSAPANYITMPNAAIYNRDSYFPEENFQNLGMQRSHGFDILVLNVYPYRYNPVQGELTWYDSFTITVHTEPDLELKEQQNIMLLNSSKERDRLSELVDNSAVFSSYYKYHSLLQRDLPDPAEPFAMVVITNANSEPYFSELVTRRNNDGLATGLFLTEDIYAAYEGVDHADQIRNFIIDAYQTYSTTAIPLEYVLLGGDDEIIPSRGCYGQVGGTIDPGIPCDLYYSNLDGDWNANGNNIYGEYNDDVDMLPEIAIGRIPAETEEDFSNFFYKTFFYEDNVTLGNDIAYMLGENLNWDPVTWGGDYKDEVAPLIDPGMHIFTLYDREGTYSGMAVKEAIDYGLSIINHMGHSNETMVFGQNVGMVNNYENTEYGFAYSQGCYPAAFDEMTSGAGESIAENLVISEHGLFAFVGNTRYGWYSPGSTNGASQPYDIAFFEAIYVQNMRELGNALQYSREVLVNEALSSGVMRWVYFELILFGDPSTSVKDPCGNFPYVQPVTSTFDDLQGDGDGIANPGETIDIYVTLENLAGWSDAEDVYALISFPDNNIVIVQDSVYYGYIASGNSSTGESFIIDIPQDVTYGSYEYQLDVYAFTNRDVIFHKVYNMNIEISLYQKYWPWFTQNNIPSNPICLDFNEDGYREIMVLNSFADVHLLDIYAEELPGYPWNNEENIWKSTALADLNNDNLMDLVIASRNGKVIALSNSGEELFIYDDCMEQLLTPVIADITGDYVPEVISFGIDRNLLALDIYGQPLPGFPVMLSMITGSEFAVADLDDNGTADIMIGTNDGIFNAIDCNGDQLPGYPVQLTGPVCAAPTVLTDKKIITGTCANILYVLSPAGELLVEKELNARIAGSVIAADFDNDEILEIAFVTVLGELYIIEQDGMELPGWPVDLEGQFAHPPLAADLDNDENVDLVVLSSFNCVHAYHADGTEFGFSPVPTNLSGSTPASIEDFDHDGDYDIICGSTDGVFVIDCKLPKGEKLPWRTYRGNYNRSGYYEDNLLVGNGSEIIPILITRLDQNYPNPFNPSTTIAFQLANASGVELAVFNIKGQKVCTLSNNIYFEKGYHEIIWQGTDQNDREVPSGIYFYRFRGDGKASVRKMLLLK